MRKFFLFLAILTGIPAASWADTLMVHPGPSGAIARAISLAKPHDVVLVDSGSYAEWDLLIEKPLRLIGRGRPVIDGESQSGILTIRADSVLVSGFEIRNVGKSYTVDLAGIRVEENRHCRIEDNVLRDTFFGIYLKRAKDARIAGNVLQSVAENEVNSGNGIHLWYCDRIEIAGNEVRGHRDGIYLEFVEYSSIVGNLSEGNLRYGLHFMFSNFDRYEGNTFRSNGTGVAVMYSKEIDMRSNYFLDNWGSASYGLLLKDITDGKLERNVFRDNTMGIYADGSNRLLIADNDFIGNGWAINIYGNCQDNKIHRNNFIGNAFDITTNSARNANSYLNNYWDQYGGYDLDRDGFGDVPHRPVKLFSYITGRIPEAIVLHRSFFVDVINLAEKVTPSLTPVDLEDTEPIMKKIDHDRR